MTERIRDYEMYDEWSIEHAHDVFAEHDRLISASYGHGFELSMELSEDESEVLRYIAHAVSMGWKCVLSVHAADALLMDYSVTYNVFEKLININMTRTFYRHDGTKFVTEGSLLKGPWLMMTTTDGLNVCGIPIHENGGWEDDIYDAVEEWLKECPDNS